MAESILFGLAENLLGKLGSLLVQEIGLAAGVKNDLKTLTRTLATIKAVLLDAERQQEANPKLRVWLETLKDVCSSANNVLDDFEILDLQRQVMQRSSLTKKVRHFFSPSNPVVFNYKMGHKLKEIRLALDGIAKEQNDYNLSERSLDRKVVHMWRETHSRIDSDQIIGRDQDKEVIIDHLLRVGRDGKRVSVVPIVGIGGLGKTALAKSVFNDLRVKKHFKFTKWVSVSKDFDVKKIISNIVKCEGSSLETMVEALENLLVGVTYLLVLDDVWNEDANEWERLRELLMCGANGSKIVITTRSPLVASITRPTYTHILKGLSDKDSLALLMKQAFGEGNKKNYPYVEEYSQDIIEKCKGVPLAIRTLGSHLYMRKDVSEWRSVRDREICHLEQGESGILPALKLSYDDLPSYLKQCFTICSMFEKSHEFSDVSVIYLWMALGLLERGQNLEMEEIGKRYLNELLSRSFFQDYREFEYKIKFKMHDLMHDLAISLSRSDCARLKHDSPNIAIAQPKVVSFDDKNLMTREKLPESILKANNLQMIRVNCDIDKITASNQYFLDTCIARFKFLRVLDLKTSNFDVLPKSVGGLKHLRYLDLLLNMKLLPNSLCKLVSLQYLRLENNNEGFDSLPKNMKDMISLRYLKVGTNENCFPIKGIGSLTCLRTLIIQRCKNMKYLFNDNDYDKIGGMQQNVPNLRTLVIKDCNTLVCLPQSLKYLSRLQTLKIANCKELDLTSKNNSLEEVGNLVSLQVLVISRLNKLVEFPPWLPQGGTCLKKLEIRKCDDLTKFPEDMKYLRKLIIADCPKLFSFSEGSNSLPCTLEELVISDCPVLRQKYETGQDCHKISHIPNIKFTSSLARWRQAALILNTARRFSALAGRNRTSVKEEG